METVKINDEMTTYWFQLIQRRIGLANPNEKFIESMLELTKMKQRMFQLLLAINHASEKILPSFVNSVKWFTDGSSLFG